MPAVVRLLRRFKRDKLSIKFSRINVYARDGFSASTTASATPLKI